MPYYPAGSLAGRLSGAGPLPWAEVAAIGVRMSGALQTAHDAGILHRDIKPANILLDEYGGTRLADFGQARLADSELTRTGEMTLTPGYAAPEMLEGGAASAQSDIYSLAVTLAALVIGRSPFANDDGDLVGLLYRVVHTSPPDLRPAGVPDVLAAVLERGMAKRPEERYPSAEAFGAALQQVQRRLGLEVASLVVAGRPAAALPPVPVVATDPALPRLAPAPPRGPPAAGWGPAPTRDDGSSGWTGPSPPPRRRRTLALVVALVVLLAAVAGGVLALVQALDGRGSAAGPSATADPSGAVPTPVTTPSTAAPSATTPSATITPPPEGTADVSSLAQNPQAEAVAAALTMYFTGINAGDLRGAYDVFTPTLQGRIPYQRWSEGLDTSMDSDVVVRAITDTNGGIEVTTTFTSRQSAEDAPSPGETCSRWGLIYTMVDAGGGALRIDSVRPLAAEGHVPC